MDDEAGEIRQKDDLEFTTRKLLCRKPDMMTSQNYIIYLIC